MTTIAAIHRTMAKDALWFSVTYGLLLKSLVLSNERWSTSFVRHPLTIAKELSLKSASVFLKSKYKFYLFRISRYSMNCCRIKKTAKLNLTDIPSGVSR